MPSANKQTTGGTGGPIARKPWRGAYQSLPHLTSGSIMAGAVYIIGRSATVYYISS
jgi:hypothetical protein